MKLKGTEMRSNKTISNELKGLSSTNIRSIIPNSDKVLNMQRLKVYFKNGHNLSIIRGPYSHGGPQGLFEIMPSDPSFLDEEDSGDTVCGHLTHERVSYYIEKIGSLKLKELK